MIFRNISYCLTFIWVINYILYPTRFSAIYDYIPLKDIIFELDYAKFSLNNIQSCDYKSIIMNTSEIDYQQFNTSNFKDVDIGGEYEPKICKSPFNVALVIPYRKRSEQLHFFLNYFHNFLQNQQIHYRIFIVDQQDNKPFNRAKLLNIGAYEAIKLGYSCLILHDVDLIPIVYGNLYACTKKPRHMSTNLDEHRFNLLYQGLSGGAMAILSKDFELINGMSNIFYGWGGEDDDFYDRLSRHNLKPYRYDPKISKYIMLRHKKERPNDQRYELIRTGMQRYRNDGLNSLNSKYNISLKSLFTHIQVYDT